MPIYKYDSGIVFPQTQFLYISLTLTFPLFPSLSRENVTGKIQSHPPHCQDPTDGPAVAQEGPYLRLARAVRCSRRPRGGLRGRQLQEVHRARDAP